ncbi:glycosyltransferase [Kitasatospora sp. MAP5-34]|uniref:glycosyltransferase n=1 Tax=Kitasatospora sp. MAP5-34 TaxID=3035102 RepID=UPI00247493F7|nr:glycosyltransferase [Kitasatospora sp. MAP5-34]MDH6579915.1 hypothetical protein [Kitasatospora sp. MAP5-34]
MNILLCPLSDPGFRYPAVAVGLELSRRGHAVHRLDPVPGSEEQRAFRVDRWFRQGTQQFHAVLRAAREHRAEALVTSVLAHGALLAAEVLDIPVVVLGLTTHLWPYRPGGPEEQAEPVQREWRLRETVQHYERTRESVGLAPRTGLDGLDGLAGLAGQRVLAGSGLLLRGDPALELPGAALPEGIRHVGPCWWEPPADEAELRGITAHTERIGKPVVYVHLGRSFGGNSLWPWLNATFAGGPFQAVVELGRSGDAQQAEGTDILAVRKPWMDPLVRMASVVVTNGTSAPVLSALLNGRPLVVAPAGGEQHVLAEACLRAGVAQRLQDGAEGISRALADRELPAHVHRIGDRLRRSGSEAAADFVERAVSVAPRREATPPPAPALARTPG